MANNTTQAVSSRARTCEYCGRRLLQNPRTGRLSCDTCRTSPTIMTQQRPGSQPSSTDTSIPSTYLDLLDSKIAEYEHAAERSNSNGQSTNTSISTKPKQSSTYSPYIQDSLPKSSPKSSRSPPKSTSVVMARFLNDPIEPDGV